WLIALVFAGYLCGLIALFVMQRSLIFPIPPVGCSSPASAGFPQAEEHVLTTSDGEKVIVWHVPAKPGHPVVLFFHGNGDFLAGRVARFRGITADGTGLVALSYRGYAGSTGTPSEQGLLNDAAAACAFTAERYKANQIVVWGFSLGTGVAVAVDHPIGTLILEAPYTSIADVAAPVNGCSRWLTSRSSSSGFQEAATKISTIAARCPRRTGFSMARTADGRDGLVHA